MIAYPFSIDFSKKNNSVLLVATLKNPTKSFNNTDLVEIIKFDETILFLIKEFKEIFVLIDSSSIFFFLYINLVPIVFALILKFRRSNVNFILFNLTSN